jgi:hypothetical protein
MLLRGSASAMGCACERYDLGDPGDTLSTAGDLTGAELQQAITSAGPTDGPQNDARIRGLYSAVASVATGGPLTDGEIESAMVGVASMVNPALGAALGIAVVGLNVFVDAFMAAAQALGIAASGGPPYVFCATPPKPGDADYVDPSAMSLQWQGLAVANTPPGSFERFAAPIIARNLAMAADCLVSTDPQALLAQLQATWNESHSGPAMQVPIGNGVVTPGGTFGGQSYGATTADILGRPYNVDSNGNVQDATFGATDAATGYPENLRDLEINRGPYLPGFAPAISPILANFAGGIKLKSAVSSAAPTPPSTPLSTPAKVAIAVASTGGLAGVGWLAINYGPDAWKSVRGFFGGLGRR